MTRFLLLAVVTLLLAFLIIVLTSTVAISEMEYIYLAESFQLTINQSQLFS